MSHPFDLQAWNRHALLTAEEMRTAEEACCAQGPLVTYDLMQNAGRAVARVIQDRRKPCRVLVLCGPGNNGGDGYVAAEVLRDAGWPVKIAAILSNNPPQDAACAALAWQGETQPLTSAQFDQADLVIDALFGMGLQRPIEGELATVIETLNASKTPVVAVDIPSGVDSDTGKVLGVAVQADVTVAFFRKKRGQVLLPGMEKAGEVFDASIGMEDVLLQEANIGVAENDSALWLSLFPFPKPEGHKYTRGHALVYGGEIMTGASRLAARAAQRLGAGLVTLAAPQNAVALYAAALESVIVRQADKVDEWRDLANDAKRNVILIGPGTGVRKEVRDFVLEALATRKPCVLDADAFTVFADDPQTLFRALHSSCVLTPHEGEFARLFGSSVDSLADKIVRTRKAAATAACVVLLKGADTVIASPEGYAVVNHNAPPWLATAGAGDVLGGMILGLLAAGMPPFAASAAAAWLHGCIANDFGPGLIAEDLVDGIPAALKGLSAQP